MSRDDRSTAYQAVGKKPPLLLVSNQEPTPEALTDGPCLDFLEVSRALSGAPLMYVPPKRGPLTAIEEKTASDLRQAMAAFRLRRKHSVFVSFSEKVGLPLALMLGRRGLPHVLLAHNLTSDRKRKLQKRTGFLHRFTAILVICEEQRRYLLNEVKVDPKKVHYMAYMVDSKFWSQDVVMDAGGRRDGPILSVGRERRDYDSLALAARMLSDRQFLIVASSPWSRAKGNSRQTEENLQVRRNLPYGELRNLYAQASAVVVPLEIGTAYAAGATAMLEAMAMGNAPIVTRTPGIAEYIEEGVTGRWAPAGDPEALAAVIHQHLSEPETARRMGIAARRVVESHRNADTYVGKLVHIVNMVREN